MIMKTRAYDRGDRFVRATFILSLMILSPAVVSSIDCSAQERQSWPQQSKPPAQASQPDLINSIIDPNEDYQICPGDLIEIQIERAPELSGIYRVGANGTFLMKYLGRMTAQQKTQEELAVLITEGLRGRYLKNPQVSVTVKQINSHAFFIQGAVNRPGMYQMEGRPSLLKLITVAGGLTENHGSQAFIIREVRQPKGLKPQTREAAFPDTASAPAAVSDAGSIIPGPDEENEKYELIRVNVNGLFRGNFDHNMYVEPGSLVNIPRSDVFFVAGEVHAPGSFPLKEGTTLRQAISLAQGTTFKAANSRGIIFREDSTSGKRQEIKVDVNAVMNGNREDIAIIANDIIIVPNSRLKSVGGALLSAFGFSAVRVPIRR
jgi:polysaccharide export outer membrane protein